MTLRFATASLLTIASLGFAGGCSTASDEPIATYPTSSASPSTAPSLSTAPTPSISAAPAKPEVPPPPRLKGNTRNLIAFAPLSNPKDVTVLGSVPSSKAWSTSKVLVVMAFIKTTADGDPENLEPKWRQQIKLALTESNMNSLLAIRGQISGGSGAPMTEILRSIGDDETTAPDSSEGSMEWTARNQVKFMAALDDGKVVSRAASEYVLNQMKPIKEHSWGLGTIGASAFKGGWLTPETETRQMGIVGDYAVAIITDAVGPAVPQTDGDSAHVKRINKLAKILQKNLAAQEK